MCAEFKAHPAFDAGSVVLRDWPLGQEHRVTVTRDFGKTETPAVSLNLTTAGV